jgi:hypothetical protein
VGVRGENGWRKTEMTTDANKGGRPSGYSEALAEQICSLIREGLSERQISMRAGMPSERTLCRWKDAHPEFCRASMQARAAAAEAFDDQRRELCERLAEEAQRRAQTGEGFPDGVVHACRIAMQELARSAAVRDDSRYGDRKRA